MFKPRICKNCGGTGAVYYKDEIRMERCEVCDGRGEVD